MQRVVDIKAKGVGQFALDPSIKRRRGGLLQLVRDDNNQHGRYKVAYNISNFIDTKSCTLFHILFIQMHAADYEGDHVGHIDKKSAAVLSQIMDLSSPFYDRLYGPNNVYGHHFDMFCLLKYCDTTHSPKGYEVAIVVETINTFEWTDILSSFLNENNMIFERL
jgi:hypothetical protein